MSSNEPIYLTLARTFADPSFLAEDWFHSLDIPSRLFFHLFLWPLNIIFSLPLVSIIGRVLAYGFLSFGLGRLANALQLKVWHVCATLLIYFGLNQGLIAGEWVIGNLEAKVIAYGFIFWALAFLLEGRLILATLALAMATNFHVLVGGWCTLAFFAILIVDRATPKTLLLKAALAWAVSASYSIGVVLWTLFWSPSPSDGRVVSKIYVLLRAPHHLDPLSWKTGRWIWVFFALALTVAATYIFRKNQARFKLALFLSFCSLPFLAGLLITPFSFRVFFLQYYPFRVYDTLAPLLLPMIFLPSATKLLPRRIYTALAVAILIGTVIFSVRGLYLGIKELQAFPQGARGTKTWHAACNWIKSTTLEDARILTSPRNSTTSYLADRAVVVTFKHMPEGGKDIEEWIKRMKDLNGGRNFKHRGFRITREVDKRFHSLSTQEYLDLAKIYETEYLMLKKRRDLPLPQVYQNKDWTIYRTPVGLSEQKMIQ